VSQTRIGAVRPALTSGPALAALIYLDSHLFWNKLRQILREPKRWILWLIFIGWAAAAIPARLNGARRVPRVELPVQSLLSDAALFVPGIALLVLGMLVLAARQRAPASFRSAADARFICGSALPPRLTVAWLEFRRVRIAGWRLPIYVLFWVLILPSLFGFSVKGAALGALAMVLVVGLGLALQLPVFVWQRRSGGFLPGSAGWAVVGLGSASLIAAALRVAGDPDGITLPAWLTTLPPGSWVVGGFAGDARALLPLALLFGLAFLTASQVAGDAYPELWESSVRSMTLRRLVRRRGGLITSADTRRALREAGVLEPKQARRSRTVRSSRGAAVPTGAWTLLWKEWLATWRMPGALRLPVLTMIAAVLAGAGLAALSGRFPRGTGAALTITVIEVIVLVNLVSAFTMAADLRKPLWWLSAASLEERLLVLTLARTLRLFIPFATGIAAAAVVARSWMLLGLGLLVAFGILWDLRGMSVATYALLPSPTDMRGPGALLRVIAFLALLTPVVIAFGLVGALTRAIPLALLTASLVAVAEGWLLVRFGSHQLAGNGYAYAQAERR
jgi:hypothetical protein